MYFDHRRRVLFMNSEFIQGIRHLAKQWNIGIEMEQGTFVYQKRSFYKGGNGRNQFFLANTGQEAQPAKINSENGNIFIAYKGDRVKQGAVPTQADNKIDGRVQIPGLVKRLNVARQGDIGKHLLKKGLINNRLNFL